MRALLTMSYIINIVLDIIPTLYEGYTVQCTEWLWKFVLLTLAAFRGVTDLYLFIRTKHRTRANEFCETGC